MGRKKKHPEHINLERWLISYADFITLLFATFVVLYALSQTDIQAFKSLEKSIKQAFEAPSIMDGSQGVMAASDNMFDQPNADAFVAPLMMEYTSQKYEEQSFDEIQKSVNELAKEGSMEGLEAERTDRGLLIRFSNDCLFSSGSATLNPAAQSKLDKLGAIIGKKFYLHLMRVEGHTDNQKIYGIYPSNWELSSARSTVIIRYMISRFRFIPSLFTAVGFADTRPIADNNSPSGRAKNRRVEILILKNKYTSSESPQMAISKMDKKSQDDMQRFRMETINKIESISDAAKTLAGNDKHAEADAVILNSVYDREVNRISKQSDALGASESSKITGQGTWLKPPGGNAAKQNTKDLIRKEVIKEFKVVN